MFRYDTIYDYDDAGCKCFSVKNFLTSLLINDAPLWKCGIWKYSVLFLIDGDEGKEQA